MEVFKMLMFIVEDIMMNLKKLPMVGKLIEGFIF